VQDRGHPSARPWRTADQVELLPSSVSTGGTSGVLGACGAVPPVEYEPHTIVPRRWRGGIERDLPSLHRTQGGSRGIRASRSASVGYTTGSYVPRIRVCPVADCGSETREPVDRLSVFRAVEHEQLPGVFCP
jgi:hypothetical protein